MASSADAAAASSSDVSLPGSTDSAAALREMATIKEALHQRQRRSEQHARAIARRDPTMEALIAGCKWGVATTAAGGLLVMALNKTTALRFASPAGKAWLVTAAGMGGFLVASEKAVVSGVADTRVRRGETKEQ